MLDTIKEVFTVMPLALKWNFCREHFMSPFTILFLAKEKKKREKTILNVGTSPNSVVSIF